MSETNQVTLTGTVKTKPVYDHTCYGIQFYKTILQIPRLSEAIDEIPVILKERQLPDIPDDPDTIIRIAGEFHSHNKIDENGKRHLTLQVIARTIEPTDEQNINEIKLDGYLCKSATYRITGCKPEEQHKNGNRKISDVLMAVNRNYNWSDYIPVICWDIDAMFASAMEVGTRFQIEGRIQSREYRKKIDEDTYETRTAYEVSATKLYIEEKN